MGTLFEKFQTLCMYLMSPLFCEKGGILFKGGHYLRKYGRLKITLLILGHWHFLGLPCCQSFCPDPPINQVVTLSIQRHFLLTQIFFFFWRWCCISLSVFGIIMAVSQTEMKNHLRIAWCKMLFWHLQQKVIEVCF